jgi:hypothetical protein
VRDDAGRRIRLTLTAKESGAIMSDEPFYSPTAKPTPPRAPQPGELLFEFLRGHDRFLCELRDRSQYGVEAQFYQNEELLIGRRFETRAVAVQWAELKRAALEKGGA